MAGQYSSFSSSPSSNQAAATLPLHLCFFLAILFTLMGISWYINYEPVLESLFDQLKLILVVSPLLLLLALRLLSAVDNHSTAWSWGRNRGFPIPLPQKDTLHRAGGTPWGVAFLLVFLLFAISYQSYFHDCWFRIIS